MGPTRLNFQRKGFTLVELLIVVAIIGVLSTIGVPTFRRMIQKSKQAEGKVRLGGLYKAEAAFQAEHDVYTNSIDGLGIDQDEVTGIPAKGNHVVGLYSFGFFDEDDCEDGTYADLRPSLEPWKSKIARSFPDFSALTPQGYVGYYVAARHGGYCRLGSFPVDGSTYEASATAVIAPNVPETTYDPLLCDQWTIDHLRQLKNVHSGVQ